MGRMAAFSGSERRKVILRNDKDGSAGKGVMGEEWRTGGLVVRKLG